MARASDTRERILDAGADLFRRQGYEGTGLKEIVRVGGAPWGSLYHFFPGGKEELGVSAVRRSGERYGRLIERVFDDGDDPAEAVRRLFWLSARALEDSDYADGCPVVTVALETASTNPALRQACAEAFQSWLETMARALERGGAGPRATELALVGLSAFEGAIALSRCLRTTAPLLTTAEYVAGMVESSRRSTDGGR